MNTKYIHAFRHAADFTILAAIIAFGLIGIIFYRFDFAAEVTVVILMSVMYIFWGVMHHYHDGDLTMKTLLEYIAMSVMISFILIVLLLRA